MATFKSSVTQRTNPSLPHYQNKLIKNLLMSCVVGVFRREGKSTSRKELGAYERYQRDPWTVRQSDDTAIVIKGGGSTTQTSYTSPWERTHKQCRRGRKQVTHWKPTGTHSVISWEGEGKRPSSHWRTDGSPNLLWASVPNDYWSPNILHLSEATSRLSANTKTLISAEWLGAELWRTDPNVAREVLSKFSSDLHWPHWRTAVRRDVTTDCTTVLKTVWTGWIQSLPQCLVRSCLSLFRRQSKN